MTAAFVAIFNGAGYSYETSACAVCVGNCSHAISYEFAVYITLGIIVFTYPSTPSSGENHMHVRNTIPGFTAFLVCLAVYSPSALAQQCDCRQVVGKCTGAIELLKTFGSAPSFGAELAVYSSEKVCSKVEYTVDATPYQTVLVNRSKDTENLFGTSPITKESVRYSACFVCKNLESARKDEAANGNAHASAVLGTWSGYTTSLFGRQDATLSLSIVDGKVSGTYKHPKVGDIALYDGTYSDGSLNVKCNTNDGPMQWVLQLTGETLQGSWRAGIWSGNVQLTRR